MSDSNSDIREWLYIDNATREQKGPLPPSVLLRLLDKGIGISNSTLVWKFGMIEWMPISSVEPFKNTAEFLEKSWFFVDSDGDQKGPIITRMLIHKIKEGLIDGLTMIFSHEIGEWKKLVEIESLKEASRKIAMEEEKVEAVMKEISSSDIQQQIYFDDDSSDFIKESYDKSRLALKERENLATTAVNQSFKADDGVKYKWDDEEQDWVEDSEPDEEDNLQLGNSDDDSDEDENGDHEDIVKTKKKNGRKEVDNSKQLNALDTLVTDSSEAALQSAPTQKRKRKSNKNKKKKGPSNWIYINGLPHNITTEEIKDHFSKVGLIAISPLDQQPKLRIYFDEEGNCKGDCSLCYNAPESVQLAIDILNDGYIRPNYKITITKADFSAYNSADSMLTATAGTGTGTGGSTGKRQRFGGGVTLAQRKVAANAMKQALAWNEDDDIGVSKAKALKIVVLEGMFTPADFINDIAFASELEDDVASECSKCGEIDKITCFSENPKGVVIVKYKTSFAAQECIRLMDGRFFATRRLKCYFWDGATNFSISSLNASSSSSSREEEEEEGRLDSFGDWLEKEQENLPDEFKLRVEDR